MSIGRVTHLEYNWHATEAEIGRGRFRPRFGTAGTRHNSSDEVFFTHQTQGGIKARGTRIALPWATVFNPFGVSMPLSIGKSK
jgi:hypothetical protein